MPVRSLNELSWDPFGSVYILKSQTDVLATSVNGLVSS